PVARAQVCIARRSSRRRARVAACRAALAESGHLAVARPGARRAAAIPSASSWFSRRSYDMASNRKVIITCAVTGAIHTPSMSPYLPVTADEIAAGALGAAEAGAAIVHLHARDPKDGRPTQDPARFKPFLEKIKASSNVVVN